MFKKASTIDGTNVLSNYFKITLGKSVLDIIMLKNARTMKSL